LAERWHRQAVEDEEDLAVGLPDQTGEEAEQDPAP
jgi:hypothetical protein